MADWEELVWSASCGRYAGLNGHRRPVAVNREGKYHLGKLQLKYLAAISLLNQSGVRAISDKWPFARATSAFR